jgi:predicted Zn-dependent protease
LRLAQAHLAMRDPSAAEKALVRATTLKPGYAPAVEALVALQLQQGRLDDALGVARELRKQAPDAAAGYVLEADIHAGRRNWDTAAAALRKAMALEPKRDDLAMKLHGALLSANKRSDADAFAASWTKAHPDDVVFELYLGEQAMLLGEYAAAEARFLAVAQRDPRNASVQNNLAWLALQRGKPGALAFAERANSLRPEHPAYLDTLASVLAHENRVAEALSRQKQALQLQPANAQLRLHLAELYLRAGDKPQARNELDALSKLGPAFGGHAQVEQLIKTL